MNSPVLKIRRALVSDAHAIAEIHVASWQSAYAGIMPNAFLDGLSVEKRAEMWREILVQGSLEVALACTDDQIAGWIAYGACRDTDKNASWGEIVAINLHPSWFRRGIGTLLIEYACSALSVMRFKDVLLWTLTGNARARAFYDELGFVPDGQNKEIEVGDARLGEMRYWRALAE
jgi:ribosomal protein S18 acetylase RimI-like enzyme